MFAAAVLTRERSQHRRGRHGVVGGRTQQRLLGGAGGHRLRRLRRRHDRRAGQRGQHGPERGVRPPDATRRPDPPAPLNDLGRPVPAPGAAIGAPPPSGGIGALSTKDILTLAGPLLAFSGAALFAGSVAHPHNLSVPRSDHAIRRLIWLTSVRVAYFLAVVLITSSRSLAIVAGLSALSAPAFAPIQQAVLYGYRSGVVNAAARWGWVLTPFGLGLAALLRIFMQ